MDNEEVESKVISGPKVPPVSWPHFKVGDVVKLWGIPFELVKINMSSFKLAPIPTEQYNTSRRMVRKLTARQV